VGDLGPLFVPPSEPHRLWILVFAVAVPCIVVALIVLVRSRLPTALASTVMLLLPVFTYVLGDLLVLEESKSVRFCGSCHQTMSPVVQAMRSDGETLSAVHYQTGAVSHAEACYECHSGYGIWGTVDAKMAGVKHMIHTVTGNFDFPLKHHGTFDISSCLSCHAAAKPFRKAETHRDEGIQQALLSGAMGCTGVCHPAAHPESALNGAQDGVPIAAGGG
jgi:nitrate/TMAO reductase-like tetraheme cytochrome c subunit